MISEPVRLGRRMQHSIPVFPPVKNYLEKYFPNNYVVSKDEFLGMWCINATVRKTKQTKYFTNSDADHRLLEDKKFTEKWAFVLPLRYSDNVILPKRRVFEFHNMIMKCMYTELLQDMEIRRTRGDVNYIQAAINDFRDKYQIRDNYLEDERIRKMYLRFREKQLNQQPLFSGYLPGLFFGKLV